jgi:glycosyltransferase involved in cell wall biosynthesis
MKVLVLHSELGVLRGGGENFTRNLFVAFAKRGHNVAAAFVANRHSRYPIPLPAHIKPIPIAGWWSRKLGQEFLSSLGSCIPFKSHLRAEWDRVQEALCWRTIRWHDQRFQRHIESEFSRRWNDFDAVYVHGDTILASKVSQYCPTVLRLPGPVTAELTPMLRAVHAVCANGDALVRIRALLGDHVVELPIGLDVQVFTPGVSSVRSTLGWADRHCVVGYVGRLTHLKGVDLLAAAFREIAQETPDVRLLIIGSGEEERHIRTVLAQECARAIVHIEPDVNHEQLPAWYRAMDLMVMPSRYENYSNTLLEAMACGIPFLASNIGGNQRLSETGAGWLFEPESISSLRQCLHRIIEDRPALKARGEVGSRALRHHSSWAASAERLEAIIRQAMSASHLGNRLALKAREEVSARAVRHSPCSE